MFRNVLVHSGPFRYCTKLGAKCDELVQLMQKIMPRSRVGTFLYERALSTPLDSKLMFCCISESLGAFGIVSLLHETRCKMGRIGAINAKVHATMSRLNFSLRTHPIHTMGP